ncbi:MAG: sirohydrochlorin cobaltochelatase, partial [bacterium]
MKTQAVIFALPGTSSSDAAGTLRHVDELFGRRFGDIRRIWAYTSSGVRRKLEKLNTPVSDPGNALDALFKTGITHVAVKSLHLATGMEYK